MAIRLGLEGFTIWPIGKHKGKQMNALDVDYLVWVYLDSELDTYLKVAAKKEMLERGYSEEQILDFALDKDEPGFDMPGDFEW